jgi:hypothetical protein
MSNTITNVMPKILADGVMALREQAIFAQLVNRALQSDAQKKGNVVNVPIPSAIAARAVTPAVTYAANVDASPTVAIVTLDQWYEAPINLSDSDAASVDPMFLAMQASEAIKSLANNVDQYIWGKHTGFFGHVGAAGTTPFQSSLTVAAQAAKQLNIQLAPNDSNRRAVIDPSAELYLKLNSAVLQSEQRGDSQGIIEGTIGRKLGFDWYMDQNVSTFTPGTGWVTGFAVSTTTGVAAASTLHVLNATASGTIKIGDVFTLGSDSKQYVVTANTTVSATVGVDITVYPPLSAAVSLGTTLAVVGAAYTVNLAFHRDAWAFASRPLQSVFQAGNIFQSPTDPISGIALRLELSRQYKQETLSFDVLYGANVIRPQLAVKMLG